MPLHRYFLSREYLHNRLGYFFENLFERRNQVELNYIWIVIYYSKFQLLNEREKCQYLEILHSRS